MLCIVPLAGPDFYSSDYGVKPFVEIDGQSLIELTLRSRPWMLDGSMNDTALVFVLRASEHTRDAQQQLTRLFPGSRSVVLSELTKGALMSSLAGLAFSTGNEMPVIVDLADLVYKTTENIISRFLGASSPDGVIPWFTSDDASFSYLRIEKGIVAETAEKRVISSHASAGTYFFRNASLLTRAIAGSLLIPSRYLVNGSLFLCPAYNVLIEDGAIIEEVEVFDVEAYSKKFH